MSKRSRTRKKSELKPKEKGESKPSSSVTESLYDQGNDYGGLPDRDLKKNLGGCR